LATFGSLFFWVTVTLSNFLVLLLLVLMAYGVAFFGVSWPDRVVKRRLFKWLMRGPIAASIVLALTTLLRRTSARLGIDSSATVPVVMVAAILVIEHLFTLLAPIVERWLFLGKDRPEIDLLQTLEERLLTYGDLQQFLEAVLAAVCDRLQASHAFIAALGPQGMEMLVTIGGDIPLKAVLSTDAENLPPVFFTGADLEKAAAQNGAQQSMFSWGDYLLIPLVVAGKRSLSEADKVPVVSTGESVVSTGDPVVSTGDQLLGLLGVLRHSEPSLDEEQAEDLAQLTERATLALRDRQRQQQVFSSLQELTPQMDMLQRLRAAARYDGREILTSPEALDAPAFFTGNNPAFQDQDLSHWVKEALTHYWGGPKLTDSPLIGLGVVQQEVHKSEETPVNALRTILRRAIEDVRPEGERRFTAEWILYNILEMKFMEGRKVREIAQRLAMSEADLYRKQRIAIESVAKAINQMEQHLKG
jgi:GAF domain-containing protein